MSERMRDPLLAAGKIMTMILMAVTGLVTVLLIGLIPVLLFNHGEVATILAEGGGGNVPLVLAAAVALLASGAAVVAMAFHFFQLLGRIIDTVGLGDPFTTDNAARLGRMGWIALIFQLASFPIAAMAVFLSRYVPEENLNLDIDFSLTGVLLAIVLFILARVFRQGAAMREDLEGTV